MSISISSGCRGTNLCRPRWVGSKSSNGFPMVTRGKPAKQELLDNASTPVTATTGQNSKQKLPRPLLFNNNRKFMYSRPYSQLSLFSPLGQHCNCLANLKHTEWFLSTTINIHWYKSLKSVLLMDILVYHQKFSHTIALSYAHILT